MSNNLLFVEDEQPVLDSLQRFLLDDYQTQRQTPSVALSWYSPITGLLYWM